MNNQPELHEIIRELDQQEQDWPLVNKFYAGGYRAMLRLLPPSQFKKNRCNFFDEALGRDKTYIASQCVGHALQIVIAADVVYNLLR